uniref:Uncharacterized protein n=1 Tax=Rhizophora mucronata TaxID=61149 RepID=A0A2P2QA70_RHIMU
MWDLGKGKMYAVTLVLIEMLFLPLVYAKWNTVYSAMPLMVPSFWESSYREPS